MSALGLHSEARKALPGEALVYAQDPAEDP